jgi:anti-sigma factor (TIGR02949 family)
VIGCSEVTKQLWEYLTDTIGDPDRAAIEEHLRVCLQCCGELEFAEELRRFLGRSVHEEIPDDVLARLSSVLNELAP